MTQPSWFQYFQPIREPVLKRLSRFSGQLVWHVDIELEAWPVPPGRALSGSDTWNGKALVIPSTGTIERSVGEVEIVERIRRAMPEFHCFWTAKAPPDIWKPWALTPSRRSSLEWLARLETRIRANNELLKGNARGLPDVIAWMGDGISLLCVEYKGPQPTTPNGMDSISIEQDEWVRAALSLGILRLEDYAVVQWIPRDGAREILRQQVKARVKRTSTADRAAPPKRPSKMQGFQADDDHQREMASGLGGTPAQNNDKSKQPDLADVEVFEGPDSESRYHRWRMANPDGVVLNVTGKTQPMMHKSTCGNISTHNNAGALTEKKSRKVCSVSRASLRGWLEANGFARIPKKCGNCGS